MAGIRRTLVSCCLLTGLSIPELTQAAEPVRMSRSRQREAVEAILAQPLDWTQPNSEPINIDGFIVHVREKHGLAIRWDAASLQMLGGSAEALFGNRLKQTSGPLLVWKDAAPSPHLKPYRPGSFDGLERRVTNFGPAGEAETTPAKSPGSAPSTYAPPAAVASISSIPADSPEAVTPTTEALPEALQPAPDQNQDASEPASEDDALPHQFLSARPISPSALALTGVTVGEALDQLLAAAAPPISGLNDEMPIITRAFTLDYLIDGRSVVITTRLRANAVKETRVYRIGQLKGLPPEQVAKTICHSIRPWSWRSQATEIADRLAARFPKGPFKLPSVAVANELLPQEIIQASGATLSVGPVVVPPTAIPVKPPELTAEDLAGVGQLLTGGAIAALEAVVNAVEIVHYGDPPTGVMEVLPGVLVITQSQSAHREIAALLEDLQAAAP
ncbi:hypothetical protein Pan44_54820 [Caulifigura coniformis]|uniref:Uncharacterized protein n=1 Tax=Caulifigura coniformis TaxID=2527983 RepID=A0A517SMR4_9PLAN|nr:hypothetical protein [Caulifigura coniformis]QDT57413.1 hypothetical protein Pan44_54820 [Caulifigura coniformis]